MLSSSHRGGAGLTPGGRRVDGVEDAENQTKLMKTLDHTTTKTPAANRRRRAFGDISNRKQAQQSSAAVGGGGTNKKSVSFIAGVDGTPSLKNKTTTTLAPRTAQKTPFASSKKVDFTLPQRTPGRSSVAVALPTTTKLAAETTTTTTTTSMIFQDDDDDVSSVELPAGRLWKDQHNDDYDSDISLSSFEDNAADVFDAFQQRRRQAQEQLEAKYQQDMQDVFRRDDEDVASWRPEQEAGVEISLDDLLDTLEGFELGDRVSGLEDDISI